jgi:uncharacterized protein (TIGR02271 family)
MNSQTDSERDPKSAPSDPSDDTPSGGTIGAGVGVLSGGASGAAIGTAVAGPVGTVVGAIVGVIAGGMAGKAVGDAVDPEAEDNHWRETYKDEPYAKDRSYDELRPAYRTGFEGHGKYEAGTKFEDAEPTLREDYEQVYVAPTAATAPVKPPAWDEAKPAAKAAWDRVERGEAVRVPISEEQVKVGTREVEAGAVRLRKIVHTETVNQPVELRREEVIVERVAAGTPCSIPDHAFVEGTINVPLKREQAVVEKTTSVVGEVRLNKTSESETETIRETLRKEDVEIESEAERR